MISGYETPALPETHYLDNRIFTDATIFAQEQKDIYERVWLFIWHDSELAAFWKWGAQHGINSDAGPEWCDKMQKLTAPRTPP